MNKKDLHELVIRLWLFALALASLLFGFMALIKGIAVQVFSMPSELPGLVYLVFALILCILFVYAGYLFAKRIGLLK